MKNEIIVKEDILNDISSKLSDYLEIKNLILENDLFEVLGDTFKVVGLLKSGHDLIAKRKFNAFLKGFCYDNTPTEEQLSKLYKYIDSETKAEFIADMFSKILMSNSKLACMIMGIMINDLASNNHNIGHDLLICSNALTSFFDDDIKNFSLLCKYIETKKTKGFYEGKDLNNFCHSKNFNSNSVSMTVHKSISSQLFLMEYIVDVDTDVDVDEEFYTSTNTTTDSYIYIYIAESGNLLNHYINKISL